VGKELGGLEIFGQKLWTKAWQQSWWQAQDTLSIEDGAVWIWNLVSKYFYDSHQLEVGYHATEHLASAVKTIYG